MKNLLLPFRRKLKVAHSNKWVFRNVGNVVSVVVCSVVLCFMVVDSIVVVVMTWQLLNIVTLMF